MTKPNRIVLIVGRRAWRSPLVTILQSDGYATLEANDGFEALQMTIDNRIDVLIAVEDLAGLTGRDLIGVAGRHAAADRYFLVSESPEGVGCSLSDKNVECIAMPFEPRQFLDRLKETCLKP